VHHMIPSLNRIRIVIVDDGEENTRHLDGLLSGRGYAVETTDGIHPVQDIMHAKDPDLVIASGSHYDPKTMNPDTPVIYHTDPGHPIRCAGPDNR